jgi:hypothetical protein
MLHSKKPQTTCYFCFHLIQNREGKSTETFDVRLVALRVYMSLSINYTKTTQKPAIPVKLELDS